MSTAYQVCDTKDSRKWAEFLAKEGQLLLPMLDLIERAETAVDEVIDVVGRGTLEAILLMSAREVAGVRVGVAPSAPAAVAYWSACHYWNWTEQVPRTVLVQTPRRVRPRNRKVLGVTYQFVRVLSKKFFGTIERTAGLDLHAQDRLLGHRDQLPDAAVRHDQRRAVGGRVLDLGVGPEGLAGAFVECDDVADKRVDFGYDDAGRLVSVDRYADLDGTDLVAASTYAYDAVDEMTGLTHTADGPPSVYTWQYDEAGRLIEASSPDGEVDYTHDDTDQLTGADYTGQADEAYAYDAAGNRTGGGYDVDPNNRLAFDGTYAYAYDDEGNLVTRTAAGGARREFEWDYRRRLTSVTDYAADDTVVQQVLFTYDALDNRLTKTVDPDGAGEDPAETTTFAYADGQVALEFGGTAGGRTLAQRYLYGPGVDQVLARDDGSEGVLWALADNEGTVRDLVDASGDGVEHLTYDSFGRVTGPAVRTTDFRFTYTGRELDAETGLYYNRARYYDSGTGRFLSEDPSGLSAGDPNLYRYASNNPLVLTDPTGLRPNAGSSESYINGYYVDFSSLVPQNGYVPEPYDPSLGASQAFGLFDADVGAIKGLGDVLTPRVAEPARPNLYVKPPGLAEFLIGSGLRQVRDAAWYQVRADQQFAQGGLPVLGGLSSEADFLLYSLCAGINQAAGGFLNYWNPDDIRTRIESEYWNGMEREDPDWLAYGKANYRNIPVLNLIHMVHESVSGRVVYGAEDGRPLDFWTEKVPRYAQSVSLFAGAWAETKYNVPSTGRFATPNAPNSGPGLTAAERARIQAFANRHGTDVTVVGSRASGTAGPASDFDYIICGNSKLRAAARRGLPRGIAGGEIHPTRGETGIDVFNAKTNPLDPTRPHIIFTPQPAQ